MSFRAVNMCRLVKAVIFITFVSCVLAETEAPVATTNKILCRDRPDVIAIKENLAKCFKNTVALHLNSSIVPKPGECKNVADFGKTLDSFFATLNKVCELKMTFNTTDLMKLVTFSLQNESFKDFYDDISCVKSNEGNISNTCVKGNVGFFNITKERKHYSWYSKTILRYNSHTCSTSKIVENCLEKTLNKCQHNSRKYVASLFKYVRDLKHCDLLERKLMAIPSPNGNGAVAAPLLSIPVIITLSLGAVVIVIAIIIIIVLKCKNK